MRVCLIGYGKMGEAIEKELIGRDHTVSGRINQSNKDILEKCLNNSDVAIEFTNPTAATENLKLCIKHGIPVVCGTTGWLDQWPEIKSQLEEQNGSLIFASNFSVGVQIFFALSRKLSKMMSRQEAYQCEIKEIHHTQKKDAPSGTAVSLAEDIILNHPIYDQWSLESNLPPNILPIFSERIDPVVGTHIIKYTSSIDQIEIKHDAFNRKGFATGAVLAAEWLLGKKGIFTMSDVLGIEE